MKDGPKGRGWGAGMGREGGGGEGEREGGRRGRPVRKSHSLRARCWGCKTRLSSCLKLSSIQVFSGSAKCSMARL